MVFDFAKSRKQFLAHAHVRGFLTETILFIGSIEPNGNNSLFTESIRGFLRIPIVSVFSKSFTHARARAINGGE